ncbi:MAG: phosphate-starvation-inducible PsiE family protein [bacterium]|nr:phosphate-starvation-inducible PsiE family protein [bacterium]
MRKKIQEKMFEFSYILELLISCIIGIAVVILGVRLFFEMLKVTTASGGEDVLVDILDRAMTLAIGVEFIKMLCKHTPATVIEVLLFAIARQLVVMHTSPLENLITIVSIAVLFTVRKFLLRAEDKTSGFFRSKKNAEKENTEAE